MQFWSTTHSITPNSPPNSKGHPTFSLPHTQAIHQRIIYYSALMADVSNGETRESANEIEDNINVGSRQLDDVSDADASSVDVSATTVTVADVNGEHESDSTTPPNKIPSDTVGVENSSGKDETSTTEAVPRDTHEEEVDTTKQAEIEATTIDESTASNTDSRTEPPKTIDNIENGVIYYDIDDSPSIYVDERVSASAGDTVGALESNDDDGSADTSESTQLDSKEVDPSGLEVSLIHI